MKLETVEKALHLTYPPAFRELYEAGALRWLCGRPQAKSHLFPNQLLEEAYYPYWDMLPFSDVKRMRGYLYMQVELNRGHWKDGVEPLPFAAEGEGDIFFFDAALNDPNAPVFCWVRIQGRVGMFSRSLEEFICAELCERVANGLIPLEHWWVQNQLRWLTPAHRMPFLAKDLRALDRMVFQVSFWADTDYVTN